MSKDRKVKKKKEKGGEPVRETHPETSGEDGNERDFGGLPNRNLKKNLGCGG
ncbi:hypothetical protein [Fulvivirga sedimenti]|uniref:Uncharacterized protein n=1 Tax=Fulvivirga sedimenti TaxID=2879465 RepID=A0A9X1L2S2_9BACT|nr:hypothetical protein [Fulvivirga sedimenti]MCA6078496.1 hypothetical protein [Fulvivirga sedimenti]